MRFKSGIKKINLKIFSAAICIIVFYTIAKIYKVYLYSPK